MLWVQFSSRVDVSRKSGFESWYHVLRAVTRDSYQYVRKQSFTGESIENNVLYDGLRFSEDTFLFIV